MSELEYWNNWLTTGYIGLRAVDSLADAVARDLVWVGTQQHAHLCRSHTRQGTTDYSIHFILIHKQSILLYWYCVVFYSIVLYWCYKTHFCHFFCLSQLRVHPSLFSKIQASSAFRAFEIQSCQLQVGDFCMLRCCVLSLSINVVSFYITESFGVCADDWSTDVVFLQYFQYDYGYAVHFQNLFNGLYEYISLKFMYHYFYLLRCSTRDGH